MEYFLFYLIILLTNIIQGITGFAGTILAMPFSLRLVGMNVAVPVLNLLGMLSGVYVFAGNRKSVVWKEVIRSASVMGVALIAGVFIRKALSSNQRGLYITLGIIVLLLAVRGLYITFFRDTKKKEIKSADSECTEKKLTAFENVRQWALLIAAGTIHGMFVCGGPMLIAYLTEKIKEKDKFRATISTVWIILNGLLLLIQIIEGEWSPELVETSLISIPFLFAGMFVGSVLYKHLSQKLFTILTYVLLIISAVTLFFK